MHIVATPEHERADTHYRMTQAEQSPPRQQRWSHLSESAADAQSTGPAWEDGVATIQQDLHTSSTATVDDGGLSISSQSLVVNRQRRQAACAGVNVAGLSANITAGGSLRVFLSCLAPTGCAQVCSTRGLETTVRRCRRM